MTVSVVELTPRELTRSRETLLETLRLSEAELRERVTRETATDDERAALTRLEEIAFLLGEDE